MNRTDLNNLTVSRARIGNISFSILTQHKSAFNPLAVKMPHTHYFTEVFCCIRGQVTVCTDTDTYRLQPGEMLLIPSNILHYSLPPSGQDQVYGAGLFAELCPDEPGQDLYGQVAPLLADGTIRLYRDAEPMVALLSAIMEDVQNPRNVYRTAQFLEYLTERPCTVSGEQSSVSGGVLSEKDYFRLTRLEALISSSFHHGLTLSQAASALYLSERQLSRIVRKHYGMSLQKLVTVKRLETAAKLLASTGDCAEEIGQKVGFQARSSFYRAFRLHFGTTPAEYRRCAVEAKCINSPLSGHPTDIPQTKG